MGFLTDRCSTRAVVSVFWPGRFSTGAVGLVADQPDAGNPEASRREAREAQGRGRQDGNLRIEALHRARSERVKHTLDD
jgi:hypothetical protein